jgi:chromosome segregation ATPase
VAEYNVKRAAAAGDLVQEVRNDEYIIELQYKAVRNDEQILELRQTIRTLRCSYGAVKLNQLEEDLGILHRDRQRVTQENENLLRQKRKLIDDVQLLSTMENQLREELRQEQFQKTIFRTQLVEKQKTVDTMMANSQTLTTQLTEEREKGKKQILQRAQVRDENEEAPSSASSVSESDDEEIGFGNADESENEMMRMR